MTQKKGRLVFLSAPLLVLAAALAATVGSGEAIKVDLDPAKTQVQFTLGSVLHTVHGAFQLKRGTVHLNPFTGDASGELIVDAASGDSDSSGRDRRMHKEILESAKFPEIIFRPTRVEGEFKPEGRSDVQVTGLFNLHGAVHKITVPAQVEISGSRVTGILHFEIPYVKWGLKNPSTLFLRVNSQVAIDVSLDGAITVLPRQT